MLSFKRLVPKAVLWVALLVPLVGLGEEHQLNGVWKIDRAASTAIDPWSSIQLEIEVDDREIVINRTVSTGRRRSSQFYNLIIGELTMTDVDWWTGNRHIGAYMGGDGKERMIARWLDDGRTLRVESGLTLKTSQGETKVRNYYEYRLSSDGNELTVIELRSSRNRPIVHVFNRV
jgi:hypothetical protein